MRFVLTRVVKREMLKTLLSLLLFFFLSFSAFAMTTGSLSLAWDATTDLTVTGYNMWYGVVANGPYPNSVNVNKVTSATISNLTIGNTYYFVLTAYNAAGTNSLNSNQAIGVVQAALSTPTATPIISPTPTPLTPTPTITPSPTTTPALSNNPVVTIGAISTTSVTLNWLETQITQGWGWYRISWGVASGVYTNSNDSQLVPTQSFAVTGLKPGTKYYFLVTLFQSGGTGSYVSREVSATTSSTATPSPTPTPTLKPVTFNTWNAKLTSEEATSPTQAQLVAWITANPPTAD